MSSSLPTLQQLSNALDAGSVSSVELTQDYLRRIENSDHNAFISFNSDTALEQAKSADKRRAAGESHPLLGLPIGHKDIFCIQGTNTTCGSRMLKDFVAPYTATVIQNLLDPGTVSLGKTNMDEFAMGSSNENSAFGSVKNPWSNGKSILVPGGSSGGSAAAVAAGLAPATTGTDTGGSIRQPAAFCNLTGVKPSYGRCSRYGMVAFASSLDQAGPLTHTAYDAAMLLNSMGGFDVRDATSFNEPMPNLLESIDAPLQGLKIGLPKEFFSDGLDSTIAKLTREALQEYEKLGATLVEISLPHAELALASYYVIAPAEASSNLSRFDGVRYGFRADEYNDLNELYINTRSQGFGAEVKRRIMLGTYALSSGYYDAYYAKAQKIRRLVTNDFLDAFKQVDVIMGPTTPSAAFAQGERKQDPVSMYLNDIYTIPVNLAGLPAASIPAGFNSDNLPIGLQIIAPFMSEAKLLNVAHQFQQATDWHTRKAPSVSNTALGGL